MHFTHRIGQFPKSTIRRVSEQLLPTIVCSRHKFESVTNKCDDFLRRMVRYDLSLFVLPVPHQLSFIRP
jgi:hypothetical protein